MCWLRDCRAEPGPAESSLAEPSLAEPYSVLLRKVDASRKFMRCRCTDKCTRISDDLETTTLIHHLQACCSSQFRRITSNVIHFRNATLLYSQLNWLCKVWGSSSGDYEECRLLGYKDPVRTSQETHYVSARELSVTHQTIEFFDE
jgi:hypothetical protein